MTDREDRVDRTGETEVQSVEPPPLKQLEPEHFPEWGAAAARSNARARALVLKSKRTKGIGAAVGGVLFVALALALVARHVQHSQLSILANVDLGGAYEITPSGDVYALEGNAIARKASAFSVAGPDGEGGIATGGNRRIDFSDAPCRTERYGGRAPLGSTADAIFVSATDDRVVVFGTRSADAGERHVSVGCFGHLDTGETRALEVAMPDLALLLGTADTSTLHLRAGIAGRMYVWSAEVPLTVFDGNGASSRLLAGEKSRGANANAGVNGTTACAIADATKLVVACAVPSGEPGQAELRVSVFGGGWPPVRASYDVLPISVDQLTDFALSDDGSELATWGSKRSAESGGKYFDSHVSLTTLATKTLVFDTHWQASGAIHAARFDPDGHGIFVSQADKMDISTLRFVPRPGWTAFEPIEFAGAFSIEGAGAHKLWLVEPHSAFAIAAPTALPAEPSSK